MGIMTRVTNYYLIFWREISALIYNFTCEMTMLPWQLSYSAKMASRFENVSEVECNSSPIE